MAQRWEERLLRLRILFKAAIPVKQLRIAATSLNFDVLHHPVPAMHLQLAYCIKLVSSALRSGIAHNFVICLHVIIRRGFNLVAVDQHMVKTNFKVIVEWESQGFTGS